MSDTIRVARRTLGRKAGRPVTLYTDAASPLVVTASIGRDRKLGRFAITHAHTGALVHERARFNDLDVAKLIMAKLLPLTDWTRFGRPETPIADADTRRLYKQIEQIVEDARS